MNFSVKTFMIAKNNNKNQRRDHPFSSASSVQSVGGKVLFIAFLTGFNVQGDRAISEAKAPTRLSVTRDSPGNLSIIYPLRREKMLTLIACGNGVPTALISSSLLPSTLRSPLSLQLSAGEDGEM